MDDEMDREKHISNIWYQLCYWGFYETMLFGFRENFNFWEIAEQIYAEKFMR